MRTPEENSQERQSSLLENIGVPTWPAYSAADLAAAWLVDLLGLPGGGRRSGS